MSSYKFRAINKDTNEEVETTAHDNFFGLHQCGYEVEDGVIVNEEHFCKHYEALPGDSAFVGFNQVQEKSHRTFDTGAIRDNDDSKEDYIETISWIAMKRYAQYMTGKKSKYGSGNFKKGIPVESYEQSLVRHLQKYLANKYEGSNVEPEEDHVAAMRFNIDGIMHEEGRNK